MVAIWAILYCYRTSVDSALLGTLETINIWGSSVIWVMPPCGTYCIILTSDSDLKIYPSWETEENVTSRSSAYGACIFLSLIFVAKSKRN